MRDDYMYLSVVRRHGWMRALVEMDLNDTAA